MEHYLNNDGERRRSFLKKAAIGSLGLFAAELISLQPLRSLFAASATGTPVRVSGVVKAGKQGISGVAISDGLRVTLTRRDGSYELLSDTARPFVFMSVPSGYQIPVKQGIGTALFYQPIQPQAGRFTASWELQALQRSDARHGFIVLADPQTLDKDDTSRFDKETAVDVRQYIQADTSRDYFNLACGDIMFDRLELFPDYLASVQKMGIPAFQVVGNHDVDRNFTDEASIKTFTQHFGPYYYSFNRGEVHYVVLDDVFWYGNGYMGYIDQTQLDWLKADLATVEKGRTVVVFLHIPTLTNDHKRRGERQPGTGGSVSNRTLLYQLLAPYKSHIICGHNHLSEHLVEEGVSIHVSGAACGAWWSGDICHDGTPNGYGVYHVNGSSFEINYKSTAKPLSHQMHLYKAGSEPKAPNEIVANVWDANEQWEIYWYEDGMRKGRMARRAGCDPHSVKEHTGNQLPKKHSWVEPILTDHLYYAPVNPETKEVRVEAIAPGGRTYQERLG